MGFKKPGFTLEQHEQLGIKLQKMRDEFPEIIIEISKAYPLKTKAPALPDRALWAIDLLRSKMDDLVCEEQPGKNALDTYYRGPAGS